MSEGSAVQPRLRLRIIDRSASITPKPHTRVRLRIVKCKSNSINLEHAPQSDQVSQLETPVEASVADLALCSNKSQHNLASVRLLPSRKSDRIPNSWYLYDGRLVIWDGQNLKCQHNRRKNLCLDCGGSSICQHNNRKDRCKACQGSQICEHGRSREDCKDCGGSQICHHNKHRKCCKDCGGSQICQHNKQKQHCKECGRSGICEHNKWRQICKDCHGSGICEHNKRKQYCRECQGSAFCEHSKQKQYCKDCHGSQICEHNKSKVRCNDCYIHPENFCQVCTVVRVVKTSRTYPLCYRCHCLTHPNEPLPTRFKMKEHYVHDYVKAYCPYYNFVHDQPIEGGCSKRRPDLLLDCLTHSIVIEIDENQHLDYKCEEKRMMQIFIDLGERPLVVLRFNTDRYTNLDNQVIPGLFSFDSSNVLQIVDIKGLHQRIGTLVQRINNHVDNIPAKEVTLEKLFYDDQ